jgi:LacI family transcriptional regulator
LAGELMGHFLPLGGEVAIFIGMHATVDHEQKLRAFQSSFRSFCRQGKIVDVVEAHDEEVEAYQKCRKVLERYPSLKGIYVSTANSIPVTRALDELGRSETITVIGTDLFPAMVPLIETGRIAATIHQRPREQGSTAFRTIIRYLTEGLRPAPQIFLDPAIVMRSNLSLFLRDRHRQVETAPSSNATLPSGLESGWGTSNCDGARATRVRRSRSG